MIHVAGRGRTIVRHGPCFLTIPRASKLKERAREKFRAEPKPGLESSGEGETWEHDLTRIFGKMV